MELREHLEREELWIPRQVDYEYCSCVHALTEVAIEDRCVLRVTAWISLAQFFSTVDVEAVICEFPRLFAGQHIDFACECDAEGT